MEGFSPGADAKLGDRGEVTVRERERYMPLLGWDKEYLFYTDGGAWVDERGQDMAQPKHLRPPRGYVWVEKEDWTIEVAEGVTDADGWRYGWNVTETNWKCRIELQHTVRFRTWKRQIVFDPVAFLAGTEGTCESSEGSSGRSFIRRSLQLWENERWVIFAGFASAHLLPTDPPHFQSTKDPHGPADRNPKLEKGWEFSSGDWSVKISERSDAEGWEYSFNFRPPNWSEKCGKSDFVRRRTWVRELIFIPPQKELIGEEKEKEKEKNASAHFELITATFCAEIARGDLQIIDRIETVAKINATLSALKCEEKKAVESATQLLQFVAATNRLQKDRILFCPEAKELLVWEKNTKSRREEGEEKELQVSTASDLDIVKRCREIDLRCAAFLQARELIQSVETVLRPGNAKWIVVPAAKEEEEEEEEEREM